MERRDEVIDIGLAESFGQAVEADRELAEEIKDHDDPAGELEERSAGGPAIARQKEQASE